MVINEEEDTKYWRRIACALAFVWGMLFFLNIRFYLQGYTEKDILTPTSAIALYGVTILGCFLLVIFPLQFYIYTFLCSLWGVINIAEGGDVLEVLMYGLGIFFAWEKRSFAARWKLKLSLVSIPLIAALFSQLRYGGKTFLGSFVDIFGLFIIMVIILFLVQHELESLRKNKTLSMDLQQVPSETEAVRHPLSLPQKKLTLPRGRFKRKDVAIAQGILEGKTYLTIASQQEMGLSTVKKRAKILFEYANVADESIFIAQYQGYTVELGNSETFVMSVGR